jgi:type I restriction enzyme, S subunit
MFTQRIASEQIERLRIEAEFYDPIKLNKLSWIPLWKERSHSLNDLCAFITDGTHITPEYKERGVKFLSSTNVNPFWINFENTNFISEIDYQNFKKSRCNPIAGDILISKNGRVGTVAMYRQYHDACSLFVSVALLRYQGSLDPEFVIAFLNSSGGWFQFTRSAKTGVITNLHLEEIREVRVPEPISKVQAYIGSKVRQAERLRDRSKALENKFQNILSEDYPDIFGAVKFKGKSSSAELDDLTDNLNPGAYEPERLRIRRYLREHGGRRIQDISLIETAVTSEYSGSDVYIGLDAISSISSMISPSTIGAEEIRSSARILSEGPVISKLRPYLNKVTYIPSEFTGALGSTELFCVKSKNNVSSWFIYGVLKLDSTIRQLNPVSTGSTHPRVSREDILDLIIPWNDEHQLLGQQLEMAQKGYFTSENLTVAAKLLVEALIEGKISEADLKAAQEGLEKSDITLDREILARLTRKGIDCPNEPPLFPDLDALYATIASLDETKQPKEANHGNGQAAKVYHLHGTPLALASEAPETSYAKPKEVPE